MIHEFLKEADSTNLVAKRRAAEGSGDRLIVADIQTAGRGRMTRSFASPDGGLYFSVLLKRNIPSDALLKLTSLAAVETALAIQEFTGKYIEIKWVNDLMYGGKKICGILTECAFSGNETEYAVVGIGINLSTAPEGVDTAGGLSSPETDKYALASRIASRIADGADRLSSNYFLDEYRARLCLTGKEVTVIKGNTSERATAKGVDDNCALLLEYPDGRTEALHSFEVSLRQ